MDVWIGGEISSEIGAEFRSARAAVEAAVNKAIAGQHYGDSVDRLAFLPIILPRELGFREIAKYRPADRVVECRLKVPYGPFKNADGADKRRMILAALLRAVGMIAEMPLDAFDHIRLNEDVKAVAALI